MVEHRVLTDEELEEHDRRQELEYLIALAVQPSSRPARPRTPVKTAVGAGGEGDLQWSAWGGVGLLHPCSSLARLGSPGRAAAELRKPPTPHPPIRARNKGKTVRSLHRSTRGTGPTEPHVIDPYAPGALAAVLTAPAGGLPLT